MPIDMWSLGCILAELLTGYPLLPGEDENDQVIIYTVIITFLIELALIIELLGMPPNKALDNAKRARTFISSKVRFCVLGYPRYCTNMGDELFIDFLKRCLDWDPDTRMTPQQAMKHQWLRRRLPCPPRRDEVAADADYVLAVTTSQLMSGSTSALRAVSNTNTSSFTPQKLAHILT
uniref:Protein kinase domain-containing protein n=1 Tax=Heterorhabditis bacteriophora TaxID=37862 RepID=A0A1I7WF13_HETBA